MAIPKNIVSKHVKFLLFVQFTSQLPKRVSKTLAKLESLKTYQRKIQSNLAQPKVHVADHFCGTNWATVSTSRLLSEKSKQNSLQVHFFLHHVFNISFNFGLVSDNFLILSPNNLDSKHFSVHLPILFTFRICIFNYFSVEMSHELHV